MSAAPVRRRKNRKTNTSLQHFGAEALRIHYFVFDLLISNGHDLTRLPLSERRKLLAALTVRSARFRILEQFDIPAADMVSAVRQQQLEGVVAKRKSRGKDLVYVVRVRNGFVPATRRMVYEKLKPLITDRCPFVKLPETGRTLSGTFISGSTVLCSIVRLR